ncbi:MAG: glycosyltransferase [Nanoarchaeota archaeon]|nr:glycosyltransferase [Nanoarchaeota archaeon]
MIKQGKILLASWACHNKNYMSGQISERILGKIFKEIITFDPQEVTYNYGKKEMNESFLKVIKKERPDYIFLWLIYDEFYIDTLLRIREVSPLSKVINFFGDDDTLFYNYSRYYAPLFDASLIFQRNFFPEYKKEGITSVFITMGVDLESYGDLKIEKKYDVSFIGTPKSDRYEMIKYLINNGINVKVFGFGWEVYPDLAKYYGGKLSNEDFVRVINQSKINICLTKNYQDKPHYKGRIIEISACKSFALNEYFDGYSKIYKESKEIVMFKDKEDLLNKVKYYLRNEKEREKIAEMAYKETLSNLSLEVQFINLFKKLFSKKAKKLDKTFFEENKRVLYLTKESLHLNYHDIKKALKNFDYVSFTDKNSEQLKYKEHFQIYSLEKSGKDISICDYYIYEKNLGNCLSFQSNNAFLMLNKETFSKLLLPEQFIIKKNFFIKNYKQFIKLFNNQKNSILNYENIVFVSIPLLKTTTVPKLKLNKNELFLPKFEDKLRSINQQGKLFLDAYVYKLIIYSIFRNKFIKDRIIKRLKDELKKRFR